MDLTVLAVALRKNQTDAERKLWSRLRAKQLEGKKFRRQQPLGAYIVDFVCFEKKVIVELDGGQHADEEVKDKIRDNWLKEQGYQVVRFWDGEIFENDRRGAGDHERKTFMITLPCIPSRQAGRGIKAYPPIGGDKQKAGKAWNDLGF